MKKTILLTFLTFSILTYSQKSELKTCDCSQLTMQGENGKSAYKDQIAYTGKCITKNSDGIIVKELNYYNAQLNGESKMFYPNGNIKEITAYSGNIKHGKYILYSKNGKPTVEGSYKNKLKDGKWKYYDKITGGITKTTDFEFGKEKNSR